MYEVKQFQLPALDGLSQEQIEVHLGLYAGYVKHTNLLLEQVKSLKDSDQSYAQAEVRRRLGFEFDGMKMHELYFGQLEGGATEAPGDSHFLQMVTSQFGDFSGYLDDLRRVGATRGIGWIVTYYDLDQNMLLNAWVGDHEFGQLTVNPIFVLDMWEHAYMVDYRPGTKLDYVNTYLGHVNWSIVGQRLL